MTAASVLWGNPRLVGTEAKAIELGWSAEGRRGYLWRREPPLIQPTVDEARRALQQDRSGRDQALALRTTPEQYRRQKGEQLLREERPLLAVRPVGKADASCSAHDRIPPVNMRFKIPVAEPSLLQDRPVSLRLTYHLTDRNGWVNARIGTTANGRTSREIVGAAEHVGQVHLWLPPDRIRQFRGIVGDVRLNVSSRACGSVIFALDSIEVGQN